MLNLSHIDVFPLIYLQNEPSDIKTHYQIEKLVFSRDRLGLNGPLNNSMLYNIGNQSDFNRKNGFDLDRVQIVLNYPNFNVFTSFNKGVKLFFVEFFSLS